MSLHLDFFGSKKIPIGAKRPSLEFYSSYTSPLSEQIFELAFNSGGFAFEVIDERSGEEIETQKLRHQEILPEFTAVGIERQGGAVVLYSSDLYFCLVWWNGKESQFVEKIKRLKSEVSVERLCMEEISSEYKYSPDHIMKGWLYLCNVDI